MKGAEQARLLWLGIWLRRSDSNRRPSGYEPRCRRPDASLRVPDYSLAYSNGRPRPGVRFLGVLARPVLSSEIREHFCEHELMPEQPGPDDRLGRRLSVVWSRVAGGYVGALVGSGPVVGNGNVDTRPTRHVMEALECAG